MKNLNENLSMAQIRQRIFYTGNNNSHLANFYNIRRGLLGTPNVQIKFLTSQFNYEGQGGSVDFLFSAQATPYPNDPNHEYMELDDAPVSYPNNGTGARSSNPSKEYMLILRVTDFYNLLEFFDMVGQEDFTRDNLKAILELSEDVKLSCSCDSFWWQGLSYWLTQDNASLIPCNIKPKVWDKIRPNVKVCKHLETLLHPQAISFLLPQMAMSCKKLLIDEGFIEPSKKSKKKK